MMPEQSWSRWVSCALGLAVLVAVSPLAASDHWDSDLARAHQTADLTDLFVFPQQDGDRLVLAMTLHPFTSAPIAPVESLVGPPVVFGRQPGTRFNDHVDYRFRLRPATIGGSGADLAIATDAAGEVTITCTFDDAVQQQARCAVEDADGATRHVARVGVDDASASPDAPLRVYAGIRADPYYADPTRILLADPRGRDEEPAFVNAPVLLVAFSNVLAIVVEVDRATAGLGSCDEGGGLLAVTAETVKDGRRIDHAAHPTLSNFVIGQHKPFDQMGPEITSLQVAWNREDPFDPHPGLVSAYRDAIAAGLRVFDEEDGRGDKYGEDWPESELKHMAELYVRDFLLVDACKPSQPPSSAAPTFFEIVRSHWNGEPHQTFGGRLFNADTNDINMTWWINGPDRPQPVRGDAIAAPNRVATDDFPYLVPPYEHAEQLAVAGGTP